MKTILIILAIAWILLLLAGRRLRSFKNRCLQTLEPLALEILKEETWITIAELQKAMTKKGRKTNNWELFLVINSLTVKKALKIYDESNKAQFTGMILKKTLWLRLPQTDYWD